MKFSLIAAVVLLALAQGSYAQDATADLANLGRYFEKVKDGMVQDLSKLINNQDVAAQAQTFLSQMQQQMQTIATNMEAELRPMADNAQANLQPHIQEFQKQMEAILQKVTGQVKALGN